MITIALASLREAVKKKIVVLILVLTTLYLILFGILIGYAVHEARGAGNNNGIDLLSAFLPIVGVIGYYFSSMLVALFTIMASIGCISSEVESGVIHSILSRPIKRSEYVLGKFLGLALLVTVYSVFLFIAVSVITAALKIPIFNSIGAFTIIQALLLFILEPLALLALALFGSSVFKTLSNGIFVISIYIVGLIGSMMEQIGSVISSQNLYTWGIVSSLISPFDVVYRRMISILFSSYGMSNPMFASNLASNTVPSVWMMVYACIFAAVLVFMAVRKFGRKDIP